jgi:hypothetical protein
MAGRHCQGKAANGRIPATKQKKVGGEKMSQFASQKVVDLVSKMDRGEILTVEEQEYMDQTTRHYMDYEDELSQAPTLVD